MNNIVRGNFMKSKREFWITKCPDCQGIDGSVAIVENYNCDRDLQEWTNEGREIFKHVQINHDPFNWCKCAFQDEVENA